jgi:hypothetical protein
MDVVVHPRKTGKDWSKGKIYKLFNTEDDEFYVGMTTTTLAKRKEGHRAEMRSCPNRKIYQHMRKVHFEKWYIVLLETCPCDTEYDLKIRENYWIDTLHPTLNTNKPTIKT